MQKLNIPNPCNEDFSKMTVTERGAFCEKCSTDTYAFYNKSIPEIKSILHQNMGKEICGRFAPGQMEAINAEFEACTFRSKKSFQSAFAMTLLVVFGLGLFSCQDKQQETDIIQFQKATTEIVSAFEKGIDLGDAGKGLSKEPLYPQFNLPVLWNWDFDYLPFCHSVNSWPMMSGGVIYVPSNFQPWFDNNQLITSYTHFNDSTKVDSVMINPVSDSVIVETALNPEAFSVLAFPNPTSGMTTIEYRNLEKARYKIDVYDLNGKHYQDVYSGKIDEEIFRKEIDLSELPVGTYLVVIAARNFKETVRVIKN